MVFKQIGTEVGFLSKSFKDIKKDFSSGLGIKQSLFSFISQNDIKALNDFEKAIRNSSMTYKQAFDTYLSKAPIAIKRQANEIIKLTNQQRVLNAQYQSGKITQDQYNASMTANKAKMQALTTQTQSLTLSQKAATIASKGLSIAMNLLGNIAIMGIITLISKGVKYLSDLANHVEITKEKVDELTSTFKSALDEANSNAKRVEELADRYDELSDGVNNLGENVSLTNEEYEEYNTLVNEIADMFPTLIQGYTDEGNAILNLKGNVEALRDAYKEAQQEAYNLLITDGKDSDGNDIIKQWKDIFKSGGGLGADKVGAGISMADAVEQLKAIQNMSAERYREIERIASSGTAKEIRAMSDVEANIAYGSYVQKALGLKWDISDKDFAEAKKQAKILVQTYNAEIESALSDVETLANAYLMTNDDYKQLDEQSKKAVSIMINSLDFDTASSFKNKEAVGQYVDNIIQSIKSNDEAQQALTNLFTMDTDNQSVGKIQSDVDKYINVIAQAISEDSDKLKIRLGFDDIDSELQKAKAKFVEGRFNAKPISDFLENLTLDELNIAMQIPDLFDEGLEGATKKIREWEKNNPITLTVAFDNEEFDEKIEEATKSVSAFTSSQKDLNSALEEQKEYGQLSASTMQSLIDAGYSEALTMDKVTGAVTLDTEKYKELNNEKKKEIQLEIARLKVDLINPYKEESLAIADLERSLSSLNDEERKATKIKIANMRANLANSNLTEEQIKQKERQLADLEAMLASLDAPTFDNGNTGSNNNDNSDPNKDAFDKLYSKWQHDLEMNRVTQEEYINWLDGAYKQYFSDLTKYQDEYNKYEAEVYNARKDREQDLFDKKIENYKKLSDNALDKYVDGNGNELTVNASFDYARSQINSAITETQNRINELSLKTGFEDEIDELTSDLEDLYNTLDDINKQEIESQKEYIETLKNEYSDLMDEQIDQQKKLSEEIEKSYENRISAIDKQIDALNKVSEAEERQKSILEAEKDVKEAMLELDKAKTKKRLVYSGDGSWQLKEDKSAVDEAKKNLEDKQQSLEEAKQDEQIAKLEEQKELLETQKDNNKEYYDKVVTDLEEQKTAREKQYDILVDIYEQLGGDKKQTSLNESLVEKLTSNGDINKAVQGLTPTEMKQAITSGILTTDSNGNYAIDYSILQNNEQAIKDNTSELEKLNNQLSDKSDTVQSNTPTYNNKNLDTEGYLIDSNGKRIINDGKPIHAKNFSDEIAKRNTSKKMTDVVKGIGKFAGYDTMQDLINAMITGEYTIPKSQLSNFMGSTVTPKISQNMPHMGEYMTNAVNNTAPPINFTVNVDGSADEKTIQAMETKIGNMLISYTDKLTSSIATSSLRRQNKS